MTHEQITEVKAFLKSKGLSDDAIDRAVKSITFGVKSNTYIKPEDLNMGPDTTESINEVDLQQEERVKHFCEEVKKFRELRNEAPAYISTPESDEKIRRAAAGFTAEKQTDFPGAKHGEEWLRKQQEEQIRDSGDVMFGVDLETQGLGGDAELMLRKEQDLVDLQHNTRGIDDKMYPSKEDIDKAMEECNKNVSKEKMKESFEKTQEANICMGIRRDEDRKDPGDYYKYSNILKRMDDTHTRKNNDYGDAAYQGYKKYGDYYFLVQLHNKLSRLESLTINNKKQLVKDESIDDTLLDMANYAVMYLESRHRDD